MWCFFVWLPVCISFASLIWMQHSFTIEPTSWAKLESSCQSKQYFENVVHIMTMSVMHCTYLSWTYDYIISPQKVCFALCCIFHLSTQSFVIKFRNNHPCVCVLHLYKFLKKKEMNIFWSVQMRKKQLSLLTDVIKRYCVMAEWFIMMFRLMCVKFSSPDK